MSVLPLQLLTSATDRPSSAIDDDTTRPRSCHRYRAPVRPWLQRQRTARRSCCGPPDAPRPGCTARPAAPPQADTPATRPRAQEGKTPLSKSITWKVHRWFGTKKAAGDFEMLLRGGRGSVSAPVEKAAPAASTAAGPPPRSSALAIVAAKHGDGAIGRADEHDHARREEETVLDDAGDVLDLRAATTARRPGGGSVTPSRDGRRPMCRASSPACVATAAAAVGSRVS